MSEIYFDVGKWEEIWLDEVEGWWKKILLVRKEPRENKKETK